MPDETDDPLTLALHRGVGYREVRQDGRLIVGFTPEAYAALLQIFDARQRHRPVPETALEHLRAYQPVVCGVRLAPSSETRCVEDAALRRRCALHAAVDQVHPVAEAVVSSLSARARRLWDLLIATPHLRTLRPLRFPPVIGPSLSTINRSILELDNADLVWRTSRRGLLMLHPAVVFFGDAQRQQDAVAGLAARRRHAYRHLEVAA
ncbi:hypothetical protein [Kitasatospora griseola]|uniref:hypothetical protein n=1 Tax=Kitasatospora griseola TaxID=2064 RepID=UPI0016700296|nr:hypothetical protein [Kitasatospora griseola]GGR06819.1 hypothetical protein GCM10010195_72330 [Kitasatospora griseola]